MAPWPRSSPTCASAPSPHVLVIDQEPAILELMRELLEGEGFRVTTRQFVDAGLREITRLKPNLIIFDPPWRADGLDVSLVRQLRRDRETGAIPVVICTGAPPDVTAEPADPPLGDAVIRKPFDIAGFLAIVRRTLLATPTRAAL